MKAWRKLPLGCSLVAVILAPGVASAQSDTPQKQIDVVVKLRVHRTLQSTEETATGLFVGKDSLNAYFITACHAVTQPEGEHLVAVHSVQLQFHNSPSNFQSTVFEHFDEGLDLAVVQVPVTYLPPGLPEIVRKDAALAVRIHVIGQPSAGDWSVAFGDIENENGPNGDIHHFITARDKALIEGFSGGPVFDPQGSFLGMHIGDRPAYGIEAKSTEIVNQLAAWHVPTNNVTSVAPTSTAGGASNEPAEREAINRIVDTYAESYSRRDAQALWKVWPNSSAQTKQAIETYFRNARSITMKVTDRRIESNGAKATVMAQSSQEFTPKNGSPQRSPDGPITLELEKRSGHWSITLVR